MAFLYQFFGMILKAIYNFVGSYGWSIVLFAIFAKIITLPLSIKQTRSMQLMQMLAPATQVIQKKYANNKEKQNEETMKLYQKYKYSPLSGCLPLLIQFPILIGLYGALREPHKYVFTSTEWEGISQAFLWIKDMSISPVELFKQGGMNTEFLLSLIIPVISVVLTIIQQKKTNESSAGQPAGQRRSMSIFMTIFIAYIGFTFNQGIAIYWTLQTALGLIQNEITMRYFPLKVEPPKIVKKKVVTNDKGAK